MDAKKLAVMLVVLVALAILTTSAFMMYKDPKVGQQPTPDGKEAKEGAPQAPAIVAGTEHKHPINQLKAAEPKKEEEEEPSCCCK